MTKLRAADIRRAWKGNNKIHKLIITHSDDVDYLAVLEIYCTDIAHHLGVPVDELHAALRQYDDRMLREGCA